MASPETHTSQTPTTTKSLTVVITVGCPGSVPDPNLIRTPLPRGTPTV